MIDITLLPQESYDLAIVKGRIDSFTSPTLSEKLNEVVARGQLKIILDLGEVSFVSSAGLRVLIDIQKKCKKENMGEVLLVHVPERVCETLELAGFSPLFKFYDDVSSASAAF